MSDPINQGETAGAGTGWIVFCRPCPAHGYKQIEANKKDDRANGCDSEIGRTTYTDNQAAGNSEYSGNWQPVFAFERLAEIEGEHCDSDEAKRPDGSDKACLWRWIAQACQNGSQTSADTIDCDERDEPHE